MASKIRQTRWLDKFAVPQNPVLLREIVKQIVLFLPLILMSTRTGLANLITRLVENSEKEATQ